MALDMRASIGAEHSGDASPPGAGLRHRHFGLFGPHLGRALVGAVAGYAFGHWVGNLIAAGYDNFQSNGQNDVATVLGLSIGVVGWLAGAGMLNYPLAKIVGREPLPPTMSKSWTRYFGPALDHKVIGLQYTIVVLLFFFTGGLLAMAIRTELLTPTSHVFGPGTYISVVSEHGTIMMMMASSIVVGPLGNWLVPLMIGSRRMAFPRVESFSLWIFAAGYLVILTALPLGGFPTGWTGYAPLQTQATPAMDAYLVGFAVIGIGMICAGFNLAATIINYRAPGMSWGRVPVFVWSILATAALLTLATPTLVAGGLFGVLDRTAQTAFYVNERGGSAYLWQNLFWFFGHPEVYIMALPGFGIVAEIMPVFTRKPLFGYRISAAGMIGVALLSFFVWQHHLFQSGINPDMRPLFMLTTELISIPTGFVFLVGARNAVESEDTIRSPDVVRPGDALQLPDRWYIRRLPVRRSRQCHGPRELLRPGPFPLHDHGWAGVRILRWPLLLAAQDDGQDHEPAAGEVALLDHVHLLQPDVLPPVPRRVAGPTSPRVRVRAEPPGVERLCLGERLPTRCVVRDIRGQLRLVDLRRPQAGSCQPLALAGPGVADAHACPFLQLHEDPGRAGRSLPLRPDRHSGRRRSRPQDPGTDRSRPRRCDGRGGRGRRDRRRRIR